MDGVVKPAKNEINSKQMIWIKDKKENQMKRQCTARKDAWSPKACTELWIPKVTTVSDRDIQEVMFARAKECKSLSEIESQSVCLQGFFCSIPTEYPKAMPCFQANNLSSFSKQSQTLNALEESFCLLHAQQQTSCKTGWASPCPHEPLTLRRLIFYALSDVNL